MDRRRFVALIGSALAWPQVSLAQAPRRFRVGLLAVSNEAYAKPLVDSFIAGLRDHGYDVGRNLVFDIRYAGGDSSRFPALADELIALKPDVLTGLADVAYALRAKTTTIPIVLLASSDPVASGLVESLARPGTNITGLANFADQFIAKHVELLMDLSPAMSRVAFLNDSSSLARDRYEQVARAAAKAKGLTLTVASMRDPESLRQAFAEIEKARAGGLVVATTGVTANLLPGILDGVKRLRVPAISNVARFAENGGLLSYGVNFMESFRYAAKFVDRILKGAKPAEIPVEQFGKFEFVVNLKTARELGLTMPQSLLLRADRVIE